MNTPQNSTARIPGILALPDKARLPRTKANLGLSPLYLVGSPAARPESIAWQVGRLANQLHHLLQLARITQHSKLTSLLAATCKALQAAVVRLPTITNHREHLLTAIELARDASVSEIDSLQLHEERLLANRELIALQQSDGERSTSQLCDEVLRRLLLILTRAVIEPLFHLAEATFENTAKALFASAVRVDQLVRPMPAYRLLSLPQTQPVETASRSWTEPPRRESGTAWCLPGLPVVSIELPDYGWNLRRIVADLNHLGISIEPCDSAQLSNPRHASELVESRVAAWLISRDVAEPPPILEPHSPPDQVRTAEDLIDLPRFGLQADPANFKVRQKKGAQMSCLDTELMFNLFVRIAAAGDRGVPRTTLEDEWEDMGGSSKPERSTISSQVSAVNNKIKATLGLKLSCKKGTEYYRLVSLTESRDSDSAT